MQRDPFVFVLYEQHDDLRIRFPCLSDGEVRLWPVFVAQTRRLQISGPPAGEGRMQNDAILTPQAAISLLHPPLPASIPHLAAIEVNNRGVREGRGGAHRITDRWLFL